MKKLIIGLIVLSAFSCEQSDKKKSNMEIWLLCVDETRVVHPEARRMLNHPVNSRSEIEGKILNLLDKMK